MKPKICIDIQIDTEMKSFSCAAKTALIVKNGVLKKSSCFLRTSSLNFKHQFSISNDVATTKHFFIGLNQTTTSMVMINSQQV